MRPGLARQLVEFGRTIRLSHTLFALPFALGTAVLADPPCPDGWSLALLVACMVAARTAAMGMNRVADAALDARNPRTAGRAIPAGRLSRGLALALTLASALAFIALAWLFVPLRGNALPGLMAPAFLLILLGYSWTKRVTVLTHWVLGLCLGLAPVGVWIALTGALRAVGPLPLLIGAAVMFWTAGFDILYALQDMEVDRREGLCSIPARFGRRAAQVIAAASHGATVVLLGAALMVGSTPALVPLPERYCDSHAPGATGGLSASVPEALAASSQWHPVESGSTFLETAPGLPAGPRGPMGPWSLAALVAIDIALLVQHLLARRATPERIAARFLLLNGLVGVLWLAGVIADVATRPHYNGIID